MKLDRPTEISFGEWLKRQRKAAGWTQAQLADQVGCSAIAVRKIEAEERRPSEQIAERLADIFRVPPAERREFLLFARGRFGAGPRDANPASWTDSARSRLPAAVTSLIGREQQIVEVRGNLQRAEVRLVTLIGPPGIGKTRLGVEVASRASADFPDGVFFIELAPLDDPTLIAPVLVQTLGFVETGDDPPERLLADGIGGKSMLLVLDNCEHLIERAALLVSALLPACPRLKILATSREALRVPGEWQIPVPTLGLPDQNVDLTSASGFPALTLFAERARAARPDFKLSADNLPSVAAICAQLDGLPLAIELIAARMRIMSPQMLLDKMTAQFILSADGMRAVSVRQKTLGNAIGWSYDFLSAEEQTMLACLSVFSGGFTLEAAEAIFSRMFTDKSAFDLTTSLLDKSLLQRSLAERGEFRFTMLVTIRQFAAEVLERSGKEAQARDFHLEYFLSLAETGEREIRGPRQVEWADRIQNEQNNMRAALEWAVSTQKTETALRLLGSLGWPWEIRGHYSEANTWLDRIRALPQVEDHPLLLCKILNHIGRYNWTQDQFRKARAQLDESRRLAANFGAQGESALAEALNWFGLLEIGQDIHAARPMLEDSLALNKRCNDEWGIALSTFHLGILESNSGHAGLALALLEKSLDKFSRFGDLFFVSRVSIFLGYLFLEQGQYERTRQLFEQHLEIDTQLKFWDGMAEGYRDLGHLSRKQGELEQAEAFYEQGRSVVREHGLVKTIP